MDTDRKPRAAIACRISKAKDKKDRLGVQRQERECRKLAKALEVDVVAVYVDNDRSAYSGVERPGYDELVRSIERGELDVVLAWHPDRLHRNVEEHEEWIKLIRRTRVRIVTLRAGERDLTRAADRMVARIVAATSQYESELKAERQVSKIREQAEAGKPHNGPRPYGWTSARRAAFAPKEKRIIREMADRLLAGASQGDIVRWLNDKKKTPTAGGRRWTVARVRRLLLSPGIAGLREVKEESGAVVDTVKATWKPIISTDERERIQAILGNVRRHRAPSKYLLSSGLLVCRRCGTPMVGAGGRDHQKYRCAQLGTMVGRAVNGCGRTSHKRDTLEAHVVDFALRWATTPEVIASRQAEREVVTSEATQVRERLAALKAKEQRLNDMRVDGDISPPEHRRKMAELTKERGHLDRQLAKVDTAERRLTDGGYDESRRRWEGLTHNEQRAVLRSLLAEVLITPGLPGRNVFDPERVLIRPQWPGPAHLERRLPALTASQWADEEAKVLAEVFEATQVWIDAELDATSG